MLFDVFAGLQWRSVLVEASPPVFRELSKRRRVWLASREEEEEEEDEERIDVTILNAAACPETQDVIFYSPSKSVTDAAFRSAVGANFQVTLDEEGAVFELGPYTTELGSLDLKHTLRTIFGNPSPDGRSESSSLQPLSLEARDHFVEKFIDQIPLRCLGPEDLLLQAAAAVERVQSEVEIDVEVTHTRGPALLPKIASADVQFVAVDAEGADVGIVLAMLKAG
jgi:hypothetical protein